MINKWICSVLLFSTIFSLPAAAQDYIEVQPDALSRSPELYVGVAIKLRCHFVKTDSTWLNDREVFRPSKDYVGFTVEAGDRILAQLFFPRQQENLLSRLRRNDRLIVYGQVSSAKHDFAWIDVDRISEGWVVGEEPREISQARVETAQDYQEFLKTRAEVLRELSVEEAREILYRQEALIQLLIEKKIFSLQDFERVLSRQKEKPTPSPLWETILQP